MPKPFTFRTPIAIPHFRAAPGDWVTVNPLDRDDPVTTGRHSGIADVEEFLAYAEEVSQIAAALSAALREPLAPETSRRQSHLRLEP